MLSTLFAIVGGGLITLFIAIFIEHMKRPALGIKLCSGQNVFGRAMAIRWGRSPEPVLIQVSLGESTLLMHNPLVPLLQRMDVHPGDTEIINVAARFDNDDECYGWTNDNYFSEPERCCSRLKEK